MSRSRMPVSVGTELPAYDVPSVSAEKMKTMAALLGDPTPIHWDVESLRALGMDGRPVNQGPLNMAYVMNALAAWAGGHDRLRSWRVRFVGNVLAGQHVRVRGTLRALREDSGDRLADCDVALEVVGGESVLSGSMTVVLREERPGPVQAPK